MRELLGIYPLPTKEGLEVLERLLDAEIHSSAVFYGEQDRIARMLQYVQHISIKSQRSVVNDTELSSQLKERMVVEMVDIISTLLKYPFYD